MGNDQQGHYEPTFLGLIKNPFFQADLADGIPVLSQFTCKSYYNDPYFKQCKVLEHKQSHELIILKQISYETKGQMQKHFGEFKKRMQLMTNENIIRLRFVDKKSTQGLFGEQHKIVLMFDYVLIDLYGQSNNRMKQGKRFTNQEIGTILAGSVKGFASVEALGIPTNKVRLKNIYFGLKDQTPIIKIADSNLFPTKSNCQLIRNRQSDTEDIFLSPEEVQGLSKNLNYYNPKSGVYSLGIAMLQVCLHFPSRQLYNYSTCQINFKQIQQRLNVVKNKYPLGFFYLLRQMTERSVQHRPSFKQLDEKIPSNIKHYSPNMTLTVIPKTIINTNNAYVKETVVNTGPKGLIGDNPGLASTKTIVPAIVPKQSRAQASLAGQFRPVATANLQQVNELYSNGNAYKGQKNKQNQRHGKGKYIYADGSYFYGDWHRNKMHGNGALYYSDGAVEYDGQWKDDQFEGKGVMYGRGCDWTKYQGEFRGGKMEGHGKMLFNDGTVYIGAFRNDKPHGKGKMTGKDGTVKMGTWVEGTLQKN